ncbi:MAG: aminopeptidase N, partial [Hyphomonadaceae bacterium]
MRTETPTPVKLSEYTPYPFRIETVSLHFNLEPGVTRVAAKMLVVRQNNADASAPMQLDGEGLNLKAISIDDRAIETSEYQLSENLLTLSDLPDEFTLETVVEIDPQSNTALSGLYISGGRFCTQCESIGFRRITFWPDRPDVMSRFNVTLEADRETYPILLSNGSPGEIGDLPKGRHFAVWDDPHPKPSYLFALCAGDYDIHTDSFTTRSGREVALGVHVDKGEAGRAIWAMESLKQSMRWDEQVFDREYDLDVFNIVAVRDFNFGAMENKGLNIFNAAYVLADEETATDADFEAIESIVGHEYFHNWTGNRITCRDWFQLCLKEGLTVFRDQEFSADMRSRPVQRIKDVIRLRARQFPEDAGPLAHPVRPGQYGSIDNLYTATVYEKGAELIRMLKTLIGDKTFARGMAIYFERFDGTASTIEDFYSCFEEASGEDISAFRAWYSQAGTPEVTIEESWDADQAVLTVTLKQVTAPTPGQEKKSPLPMPLRLAVLNRDGKRLEERVVVLEDASTRVAFELEAGASQPLLSVNRGFSAPVRLVRDLSLDDRLALAHIDDDPFSQWDMLQSLLKEDMLSIAYDGANGANEKLIKAVAEAVKRASVDDPAFATLLLRLPEVGELFLDREPADPVALAAARKQVKQAIAAELVSFADAVMAEASPVPFKPDAAQAGIRALRTAAMDLVGARGDADRLAGYFETATNMTESLAALRALCGIKGNQRDATLAAFYERWKDNPLVIDKWFAVQAMSGDPESVKTLATHPDYDLANPNRVRAIAGVFAAQNLSAFHAPDGSGHELVADIIARADKRNPALAARIAMTFEQWRKLEPKSRGSAERVLKQLQAGEL